MKKCIHTFRRTLIAVVVITTCIGWTARAKGGFTVTVEQLGGGPSITLTDQNNDNHINVIDLFFQTGNSNFDQIFTDFDQLNVSATSNAPGSTTGAKVNETAINAISGNDVTLQLTVTDDRFSQPVGDPYHVTNQISGTGLKNVSANIESALNPASNPFTPLAVIDSADGSIGADTTHGTYTGASTPFTLQNVMTISLMGASGIDHEATATITGTTIAHLPEPGAIAIWLGLSAVGLFIIRRRHRNRGEIDSVCDPTAIA